MTHFRTPLRWLTGALFALTVCGTRQLPAQSCKDAALAVIDSARTTSQAGAVSFTSVDSALAAAQVWLADTSSATTEAYKIQKANEALTLADAYLTLIIQRAQVVKGQVARAIAYLGYGGATPPPVVQPPIDTTTPPTPPAPPVTGAPDTVSAFVTWPSTLSTAACTDTVTAGALQTTINAAADGDVICVAAGAQRIGTLTLGTRADTGWVVVRTLPTAGQPDSGQRVRPSQEATLATLRGSGSGSVIIVTGRGWYIGPMNVGHDSSVTTVFTSLIDLRASSSHVVLDRVYAHAPPNRNVQRCVAMQAAYAAVINSWLDECHGKGYDTQAIASWSSPGPLLIDNNHLAGAGENLLFGGADPAVQGRQPSDIIITRNYIYTPAAWQVGKKWTKKNLIEFKNARRVRMERNVLDGSWGDAQTGYAIVVKSSNQSGGCRWCGTSDLIIRQNYIYNSAAPLTISGRGGVHPIDSLTRRVLVEQNYSETGGGWAGTENRHILILTESRYTTLRQNTWMRLGAALTQGTAYTGSDAGVITARDLTLENELNVFGAYGFTGGAGWGPTGVPGLTSSGIRLIGTRAPAIPSGVTAVPSLAAGLAAGSGVDKAAIAAATAGVIVLP